MKNELVGIDTEKGVEFGNANLKTTKYDMCGILNFDDKDKISLQKIEKNFWPLQRG